jgi:hypothetical protein
MAAVLVRHGGDKLDQPSGQVGGGPVAALLGEGGVAIEIQERDRRGPSRPALPKPRLFQAGLGVEHDRLDDVVLQVPAVQQQHGAFQRGQQGVAGAVMASARTCCSEGPAAASGSWIRVRNSRIWDSAKRRRLCPSCLAMPRVTVSSCPKAE